MSTQKGLLVTCDRCGKTTFRKYIGKGETDGGYTTWDKFEEMSKGWTYTENKYLCPVCAEHYRKMMDIFMSNDNTKLTIEDVDAMRTVCVKKEE